jgi:hypothetical protein
MRGLTSRRTTGWIVAGLVLAIGQAAEASPWIKVLEGLSQFDTQVSLKKNYLGDGWEATLTSPWNNSRFDFGLADLTLTGLVTTDLNFTRRIMPAVDFSTRTVQTPLSYTFNINDGIQDLTATGSVSINNKGSINTLGFYDLEINISNRGSYSTEGYGLVDSGTTDFDIGPINVTGNIFVDALAALTEPFFARTGQPNPFAKISGRAAKQAIQTLAEDALRSKVASGQLLTQDEIESLIGLTMTASILGDTSLGTSAIDAVFGDQNSADAGGMQRTANTSLMAVPEPATVLFLGIALVGFVRRPRQC